MITRIQFLQLKENIATNRIILLTGPRKVGKRTAVLNCLNELNFSAIEFNVSDKKIKKQFEQISV